MRSRTTRILAFVATAAMPGMIARPAAGVPVPPQVRGLLAIEPATATGDDRPRSVVLTPGVAASERAAAHARRRVAASLVRLDYTPEHAHAMADRLTDDDLAIFAAYPAMLQVAGTRDVVAESYIVAGLIVAGIVVLAANGSTTVVVH